MKKRVIEGIVVTVVAVITFISCGSPEVSFDSGDKAEVLEDVTSEKTDAAVETVKEDNIYVHVCGQVTNPGVFELDSGSRVYEAVEMAGGFTAYANEDAVNLVEVIEDGQKIYIPSVDEDVSVTEASDGLVNINTADVETLCTIPGIGQTRAQAIVNYRDEYGKFNSIEDLMNVSGIKNGTFEKIKDYIKV